MIFRYNKGSSAFVRNLFNDSVAFLRINSAAFGYIFFHGIGGPLADFVAVIINAAHTGFRRKGNKGHILVGKLSAANIEFFFCENNYASAFGRFIGKRG